MNNPMDTEPLAVSHVVQVALMVYVAFGGHLSDAQLHALVSAAALLASVAVMLWARSKVASPATVKSLTATRVAAEEADTDPGKPPAP